MDVIVANIDNLHFKIETELNEQIGAYQLPFSGMDKSTMAVCNYFNQGKLIYFSIKLMN
jgi:cleavage and polyadenylation specificity factor subunit 4